MSPRAAWRLQSLGFTQVYDYVAGKADWLAHGLPTEGQKADVPRVGDIARPDVPTCQLTDRAGDVRLKIQTGGWDECLVVNDERVVLGRLRRKVLETDTGATADELMEPGPTTIRPDTRLTGIVKRLREGRTGNNAVVTTADGRLVGVLVREDVECELRDTGATSDDGP